MRRTGPVDTDIVLLGAGHAHVEVLRRFAMRPEPGVRLTLIGREPETPYSGMLPGLIRGEYTQDQARIDLAPLAAAAGARLILAEATALRLAAQEVVVLGRPEVPFDLLSIDIGGVPAMPEAAEGLGGSDACRQTAKPDTAAAAGAEARLTDPSQAAPAGRITDARDEAVAVKPIGRFLDRLRALETGLRPGDTIVVVGGGPAGTELALALSVRFQGRFRLALVSRTEEVLADAPNRARDAVGKALTEAGVTVVRGTSAGTLRDGVLPLADGRGMPAAAALWTTGVRGPAFLAASGLSCDDAGCVLVDATLRSVSHPLVFAAGDCSSLVGNPRPKAGVWAVRAGAPLTGNLRRAARGKPPRPWHPQRDALVLLGLGGGRAVGWRNGLALSGALVWRLKDWIDRRWMRMYQDMRMTPDPEDPMRCGGCGAKVGAEVLAGALASLRSEAATPDRDSVRDLVSGPSLRPAPIHAPADGVVIGLEDADDAAVLRPPPGMLLVQSVDHFRAFLDDPFLFGQIAAAHALSDLHAMGARPWTALAVAAVPYAAGAKMRADLSAMLRGAQVVLRGDGCTLVGGHSAEAEEASLGFAVTGLADPDAVLRKSGLRSGDALILTKPLGTGILLAGHMRGLTRAAWLQAAIASMCRSNAEAAHILRAHGATACTDVTGFGLAGHLLEMLRASHIGAEIWMQALPALPGALTLAAAGVESTLAPENRRGAPPHWAEQHQTKAALSALLVDPQTSGGLLAGIPQGQAAACLTELRNIGLTAACVIGRVIAGIGDGPPLRLLSGQPST